MAGWNGWPFTGGLFFPWAWMRCCNITEVPILPLALAWSYNNNNSTKNSYCLCSDLPGTEWLSGMAGRLPVAYFTVGRDQARQHYSGPLLAADNGAKTIIIALKIPTVLCLDLPGPGWLTGMGGRSPAVYFPNGQGRGAAT